MIEEPLDRWELHLEETARAFAYPPTPDLAQNVVHALQERDQRQAPRRVVPRFALAAVVLLLIFSCLLAVPPVRAQILAFLQVGIVRIFLTGQAPTPIASPPAISPEANSFEPGDVSLPSPAPFPTATRRTSVLDLLSETSLVEASRKVPFTIRLPAYPEDLGEPDRVFLQDMEGKVLIMVWTDRDQPDKVRMSLHMYSRGAMSGEKFQPRAVQETRVNGEPAVWAEGPYFLKLSNGNFQEIRLIEGHVLIWESGEITYRLETDLPLEEAVRVAESLQSLETLAPERPSYRYRKGR